MGDVWLPRAGGGGEDRKRGMTASRPGVSFLGGDNVLELHSGEGRITL